MYIIMYIILNSVLCSTLLHSYSQFYITVSSLVVTYPINSWFSSTDPAVPAGFTWLTFSCKSRGPHKAIPTAPSGAVNRMTSTARVKICKGKNKNKYNNKNNNKQNRQVKHTLIP